MHYLLIVHADVFVIKEFLSESVMRSYIEKDEFGYTLKNCSRIVVKIVDTSSEIIERFGWGNYVQECEYKFKELYP